MDQYFWRKRAEEGSILNPVDRISEVLFGLIMVLTFTGAISAATDGRQEIRDLLWAALGCNVAWGLVDGIMYLMNLLAERGHAATAIKKIVRTPDTLAARNVLRDELQPLVTGLLTDAEIDQMVERIKKIPEPSKSHLLLKKDWVAVMEIFLLVFLCTLPVALPFALMHEATLAMRVSNGIAVLMLFGGGYVLAGYAGFRRIVTALAYVVIGLLLVALTIALGG